MMSDNRPFHSPVALLRSLCTLALCAGALTISSAAARDSESQRFDYYVMALSWSPSYCLTHPDETEQCGSKGFGFILHGLWPQYRRGGGPQNCRGDDGPSARTIERTLAFMPSRHLIEHEWRTHGSCSGLGPDAYFETADRAFASVTIPAQLRAPHAPPALSAADVMQAFTSANPGLDESMLSIQCRDGHALTEVRVCLDKDTLAVRRCGGRVRNSCRYGTLTIPAVR